MASEQVQPKRPVGGAFGIFMAEKRPEYIKALAGKPASEVSKMGGEAWKKLSEEAKAPYEKKYEEAKAKFEKEMADFLAAGGEVAQRKMKKDKAEKKTKDVNKPKQPAGGAYGVYLVENREKIVKSLPAGHKITDVSKEAGKQWAALSEDAKKPYQETFLKKQEEYKAAMEEYLKNKPADVDNENKENEPTEQSPKKRKAAAGAEDSGKKAKVTPPKAKKSKKAGTPSVVIEPDVLKKAEKLGLESALRNLMTREDVMAKEFPQAKMLNVLEETEGLVNKAKHALLGA